MQYEQLPLNAIRGKHVATDVEELLQVAISCWKLALDKTLVCRVKYQKNKSNEQCYLEFHNINVLGKPPS